MPTPATQFSHSRTATVGFWGAVAILVVVASVTSWTMAAIIDATALVAHTHEVIERLGDERAALAEAVSARRAYALSGDALARATFNDAVERIHLRAAAARTLTLDNAVQQRRLDEVEGLVNARLRVLEAAFDADERGLGAAGSRVEETRDGAAADARIFTAISRVVDAERDLLARRQLQASKSIDAMRIFRGAGAIASFTVLLLAFRHLRREIRERFELEQLSRASEQRLATTLMSIGDGVISTDSEGRIERMNPVAERLTQWTTADAMGKPATEIVPVLQQDMTAPAVHPVARALRDDATPPTEGTSFLVRKDAGELPIASSCAAVRDAKGRIAGAVLVFRDRSDEQKVKSLEAAAQRRVMLSERMASVGTLAAGVAHEVNNPLAYVTVNLDLIVEEVRLLSGGAPSGRMKELEEMALDARQGAERVRKIVRGLKTFSRAEEERPEVIDARAVMELSIDMTFNEIRHRARLVKDYGDIPLVEADEARLGQVFINLLINAAQAIPEGDTATNEIRVVTATDSAGRAVVEVRDTGPGIPAKVMGRVFDPFFTTKPIGVGTGLGLSICHSIVASMGGDISVMSALGRGTTFRVVLPASGRSLASHFSQPSIRPVPARRISILIVDDEPAVGIGLGRVLRDYEVTVVTKAAEAIALLDRGVQFDLIFSDLMMAEMSGMDLYDELTRRHPRAAERMVFVTGGAFTPAAHAFLDRVTNERLEKPFTTKSVRDLVERFAK